MCHFAPFETTVPRQTWNWIKNDMKIFSKDYTARTCISFDKNHEIASLYGIPLRILYLMFHTFGYSHVFFSTPRKFCITRTTSTHFCILSHISAMFSRFKWLKNVTYKVTCKHTTTVFPLLNKKYVNIFLVNY